jgi:4-hydroxy-3-methylbut-2-enyl diphosphate reductase
VGKVIVVAACFRHETKWIARRTGTRIVRTGMGTRAAADLDRLALDPASISLLLSTGFCGGLNAKLRVGDLVVAEQIHHHGTTIAVDQDLATRAVGALRDEGLAPHSGEVECSGDVADGAAKRALAAGGALSVDLESGPLAAWASARGVPFLSCRVVLDNLSEAMPFTSEAPLWILVLRHPRAAVKAGRAASVAGRRLGAAVTCLIDALEAER